MTQLLECFYECKSLQGLQILDYKSSLKSNVVISIGEMINSKRKGAFSLSLDKTEISDKNFEILITLLSKSSALKNLRVSNSALTLKPVTIDKNL
jgi:hypothetical protein